MPLSGVEIRAASETEASAVWHCLTQAFAAYCTAYTPGAFADTVPDVEDIRARLREMHVLVASISGTIVGTVSATSRAKQGHVRGMAVLPEWHGRGVAAKLLAAIEDWLGSRGCTQVTLDTTLPLRTAMKFYEKHGYRRSGSVSDFYGMPLIEYVKQL